MGYKSPVSNQALVEINKLDPETGKYVTAYREPSTGEVFDAKFAKENFEKLEDGEVADKPSRRSRKAKDEGSEGDEGQDGPTGPAGDEGDEGASGPEA